MTERGHATRVVLAPDKFKGSLTAAEVADALAAGLLDLLSGLETIKLPVSQPSSCVFGGRDLDRLHITSASIGLDEESLRMQPNAGGLFMFTPGVMGLAEAPFAG